MTRAPSAKPYDIKGEWSSQRNCPPAHATPPQLDDRAHDRVRQKPGGDAQRERARCARARHEPIRARRVRVARATAAAGIARAARAAAVRAATAVATARAGAVAAVAARAGAVAAVAARAGAARIGAVAAIGVGARGIGGVATRVVDLDPDVAAARGRHLASIETGQIPLWGREAALERAHLFALGKHELELTTAFAGWAQEGDLASHGLRVEHLADAFELAVDHPVGFGLARLGHVDLEHADERAV